LPPNYNKLVTEENRAGKNNCYRPGVGRKQRDFTISGNSITVDINTDIAFFGDTFVRDGSGIEAFL